MDDLDSHTAHYLQKLKGADQDWDDAYHSLIEADHAIVPILIKAYWGEPQPSVRATLVEIISQHRVPETISFLSEALDDNQPEVWKAALDGFVALGDPLAVQILESAKQRMAPVDRTRSLRIDWINEAIGQIRNGMFT